MPKYCPQCGHSFPEDWDECNECEVELVYEEKDREIAMTEEEKKYYNDKSRHYLNKEFINRGETLTFEAYPYKQNKDKHLPKCPVCSSPNIEKIGALERGASIAILGIFSKKINKSFKCKNCGYTF